MYGTRHTCPLLCVELHGLSDPAGTLGCQGDLVIPEPHLKDCMHQFLSDNREELIDRCKAKVAQRPTRSATAAQLANGIPLFLDQLMRTLQAQQKGEIGESLRISGPAGGDANHLSEMGRGAAAHGKQLLELGFSVNQVVHDYGDLCQAITDLAVEVNAPFSIEEFRTLNRCLDNAIADAVTEFGVEREANVANQRNTQETERMGMLVHELRNYLHTATIAFAALETGKLPLGGSTGGVLRRSLSSLAVLLDMSQSVTNSATDATEREVFALDLFVTEAVHFARLEACDTTCSFTVDQVDPTLAISGNRERLMAALINLLRNAFKYTRMNTNVRLSVHAEGDRILLEVVDHCGGLPANASAIIFQPFVRASDNKTGMGLGLPIARRNVEADGGVLNVRDLPGTGCVFTIQLPKFVLP